MADLSIINDILTAAANLESVANNSDGSQADESAAARIRGRAERLRAFAHEVEHWLRSPQPATDVRTVAGFIVGWWPGLENGINWGGDTENDPVLLAARRLFEAASVPQPAEPESET